MITRAASNIALRDVSPACASSDRYASLLSREAEGQASLRLSSEQKARLHTLVALYLGMIWRTLRRLGVPHAAADDAAQLVFLHMAHRLDTIAEGKERSYAYSVAVRIAANTRRATAKQELRLSNEDLSLLTSDARSPEEALEEAQARQRLDAILATMDPDLRTVFVLFELECMEGAEIADVLGIPTGTVASRLRRARQAFRGEVLRLENAEKRGAR